MLGRLSCSAAIACALVAVSSAAHAKEVGTPQARPQDTPAPASEALAPAETAQPAAPVIPDRTPTTPARLPLHVGAVAGVGFPRPFSVEVLGTVGDLVDVGAEYGFLPSLTVDGVETSLWSIAGDLRIRPFRGPFFVGALAGRQHVSASTLVSVTGYGSAAEQLGLDSWFVNPRIGFQWTTSFGLVFGIDAGVQIPLASSVSSSLPLALYPAAQSRAESIGGTVLPTIDLLRLGYEY
jgi:hypothetical protein